MPRAARNTPPADPAGKRKAGGKPVRRRKAAASGLKIAGFYRMNDLEKPYGLTGLSRATLYALGAAKRFPAPVKIAGNISGWPVPAVNAWLAERGALPADFAVTGAC